MAGTITVTPQELRKKAEELRLYNESYKRQLQEMVAIKNSLNLKWEGSAKDTFNKKFEERATLFDAFYTAIQGYISVLLDIAERYENVERRNASFVNNSSVTGGTDSGIFSSLNRMAIPVSCTTLYGVPFKTGLHNIDFKM